MKETVLLYNFADPKRAMQVKQALLPLGFRLRVVEKKDYLKPMGVLAGVKEEEPGLPEYDGPGFEDEMAVLAGLTSPRIDAFIMALRKKGAGRIDYKAILTPTNQEWNSLELLEELKREHEKMAAMEADQASGRN